MNHDKFKRDRVFNRKGSSFYKNEIEPIPKYHN